ncbi:hypothetical protein [Rhodanobacter lindaniclasticus]
MSFWLSLIGYQAVWFAAVIVAGHGLVWPGVLGTLVYALVNRRARATSASISP